MTLLEVAIPLRGYVVCNGLWGAWPGSEPHEVAIPLRGYVVCNEYRTPPASMWSHPRSQSPYGAMWFATKGEVDDERLVKEVAIPLRGYVVCNCGRFLTTPATSSASRNPLTGLCGLQQ